MPQTEHLEIEFPPEEEDPANDIANRPRGSDDERELAIDLLGPFRFKTRLDAAKAIAQGQAGRTQIGHDVDSREEASEAILRLASFYIQQERERANAPRVSDVVKELRELIAATNELSKKLNSLSNETRDALQTRGHPTGIDFAGSHPSHFLLWQMGLIGDLPVGNRKPNPMNTEHDWLDRLDALTAWTGATLKSFVENYGTGDLKRPDQGGQRNMFMHRGGSPLWRLTRAAHSLFDACHPDQANSSKEGAFHQFVAAIYRYATGCTDNEDGKVDHTVRGVVRLEKALQPSLELLIGLNDALEKMPWPAAPPTSDTRDTPQARKWEIEQEYERLAEEVDSITRQLSQEIALAPVRTKDAAN